jgi:large repetitive protein
LTDTDLAVGLEVGSSEGLVGRELGYVVGVTNLGPHEAGMVVVEVEWSGAVELVSVEPSQGEWLEAGGVVRCELGEMGVGGEAGVVLVVRALEDGMLTNVVRVASGELDLVPENNEVEGVVRVARMVDLGVRQEVGETEVLMGQVWRIGVGVTNAGPSVASGVRVMDEMPVGMELVEVGVSQGEWTNEAGGLEWVVGTLGVGEGAGMEMWVRVMMEGWATNVVWVTGEDAEGDVEDNESRVGVWVERAADLGLDLGGEVESTVVLGTEARYGLVISNGGPSGAGGVVLEGRLGEGMELVEVEWEEGLWSVTEGLVRCEVGVLGVGEAVEVGLVVRGIAEGVWTNRFEVRGEEADGVTENNGMDWVSEVRREADLAVGLEVGSSEGLVGRELGYVVGVTNLGPHEAGMVVVEVEWIGKVELVSVEPSQGEWVQTAGHFGWAVGDLPALAEARVTLVVRPLRAGQVICEAAASTTTFDPVVENNTRSAGIEVVALAELRLSQSASQSPVMVGDRLSYTISVENRGDYTVGDVRLIDELPEGVELVSTIISQGVVSSNVSGVLEWSLGPLEAGMSASVVATVVPQQAGQLTNRVSLLSAFVDPENPELTSVLVVESVTAPPLTITADGSRVVLEWPGIADGYVLEVSDGLQSPSVWILDGNPHVVVGDRITVTVKVTNGKRFYRLVER